MSDLQAVTADCLTYAAADYCSALCSVECAASLLLDHVGSINQEWVRSQNLTAGYVIRVQMECTVDIEAGANISTAFLSNLSHNGLFQPDVERVLFVSRTGDTGILGYGCCIGADSLEAVRDLSSRMAEEVLMVGGETFTQGEQTKCKGWLVPAVEVRSGPSSSSSSVNIPTESQHGLEWPHATLALNILIPSEGGSDALQRQLSRIKEILSQIRWDFLCSLSSLCEVPPLAGEMRHTGMTEGEYTAAVESSMIDMSKGSLRKVVYALRKTGVTQCPINPAALLLAVANGNRSDEGKRYTFLFAPKGVNEEVFLSLSPEQLCCVNGKEITTEALAGTYPTGYIEGGGASADDKTCREHSTVTDFIRGKLSALGQCEVKKKELLQMKDVVHFRQVLSVTSHKNDLCGLSLVAWAAERLHPTPAVCGLPVETALRSITAAEKFSRGLYASYCGVLGRDRGELLVGLRSAVVHRSTVHVFAGAGLVLGSVPSLEWKEIDLKMSQFVRVLTSMRRPAMGMEFCNATAAVAAVVIEEMLRQGVGAFCVCPGARSTPFAVAIYRNTVARAMTQVVHDERAAGFYALGCARAGVLCAVLVTSGTAVSNLLPAVSEARESSLPMVLLTADRPSESREVGEAQTIRQVGVFSSFVECERDFPAPCSEAPRLCASLMGGILSDVSFSIGEIAVRRGQRVHLNFQFRKPELDPVEVDPSFPLGFKAALHPKVRWWLSSLRPYTRHHSVDAFFAGSNSLLTRTQRWVASEWRCWSVVVVVGELHSLRDATDLRWVCEALKIPCICDTMSMMAAPSSSSTQKGGGSVFLGVDRLLSSAVFGEALAATVRVIYRVGGSMISTRTLDWMSKLPLATVVRVREDGFESNRHDSTWIADHYVHGSVSGFAKRLMKSVTGSVPRGARGAEDVCGALQLLRLADSVHTGVLKPLVEGKEGKEGFSEPQIAMIMQQESNGRSPVFLSSSMACRDYDGFSGVPLATSGSQGVTPGGFTRRVGCNRGANGIDGVISSAVGYAFGCSSDTQPVTVLIGDVATLHDVSGISIAAGVSPGSIGTLSILGGGRVGKIVCVNNSGGAIFSFLPAANHRDDFFSPFLDTPHTLDLSRIASALTEFSPSKRCERVTSAEGLRAALRDKDLFFIECFGLPGHAENAVLHSNMTKQLVAAMDERLTALALERIEWTMHRTSSSSDGSPLVVMLQGWMGEEGDWAEMVSRLNDGSTQGGVSIEGLDVLTVSSGGDILSPTLFCRALREIVGGVLKEDGQMLLVGYSQGGRLGMHYRKLFPSDVISLVTMGTCAGKTLSVDFEGSVLDMWARSKGGTVPDPLDVRSPESSFLHSWYSLSTFCGIQERCPVEFARLIERRLSRGFPVDLSLRNMVCTTVAASATVDLMLVGALDSKYLTLGQQAVATGDCKKCTVIPSCGHVLPVEATSEFLVAQILSVLTIPSIPSPRRALSVVVKKVLVTAFAIPLKPPLEVLTNGVKRTFTTRQGYRIHLVASTGSGEDLKVAVGVGEAYEPVFSVPDRRSSAQSGAVVTYESMASDIKAAVRSLEGTSFEVTDTPAGVAEAFNRMYLPECVAPVSYGFEQCILHALSQLTGVSLAACVGCLLGQTCAKMSSHVGINGFASMRDGRQASCPSDLPQRQVLKMKVGDADGVCWQSDALRVNEMVSNAQRGCRWLRLDANQSWSIEQAVQFAELLSPAAVSAIEYIEEPLKFDPNAPESLFPGMARRVAYQELKSRSAAWRQISIALDETLVELREEEVGAVLIGAVGMEADGKRSRFVLKPSLLSLRSAYFKRPPGDVTISCTFECGVGLAFQILIASFYPGGFHGVHSKADMVGADWSTRMFSQLLEGTESGSRVRVSRAEELLNNHAKQILCRCNNEGSFDSIDPYEAMWT